MNILLILSILSATVAVVYSAVGSGFQNGTMCDHEGHKIKPGVSYYPPGECQEISCGTAHPQDNADLIISYESCGTDEVEVDSSKELRELKKEAGKFKDLPYPKCCEAKVTFYKYDGSD